MIRMTPSSSTRRMKLCIFSAMATLPRESTATSYGLPSHAEAADPFLSPPKALALVPANVHEPRAGVDCPDPVTPLVRDVNRAVRACGEPCRAAEER